MENGTIIILHLWKDNSGISVSANIRFNYAIDDKFIFYIADGFIIDEINNGKIPVDYYSSVEKLEFRAPTKKIEIISSGIKELYISYHGKVNSWHTLYEEDILAINFYTAWYPTNLSMNAKYNVIVHLNDSFYIVNGNYDKNEKVWYYQPLDDDVNIIALRDYEVLKSNNVLVYYFDKTNKQAVYPYYENYNKIVEYYIELYGNNKIEKTNIVILPKGNKYDGYLRESLIVFGGIRDDYDGIVHLLAHEIAHSWCQGAKADTWEDWQNETFAEWSALLYELEVTRNINKFMEIILEKENKFPTIMPIKTKDFSRPEGVHDNGVLQLYKLYYTYGKDAIKKILKAFDSLEIKTTDNLILHLKDTEDTVALSDYILDMINIS